ncbi:MAG: hypothetical protein AcusKO_18610 [Acuticoccus sp.]
MTPLYREHPLMFAADPGRFILACLLIPFVIGLVWLGWWFITNRCVVLTIDEERIQLQTGVFNKHIYEAEIDSIRTVRVDQTLVDRFFKCGYLKVYTTGDIPEIIQDGLPDVARLSAALRQARRT